MLIEKIVKCINLKENEYVHLSPSNSTVDLRNVKEIENESDLNDSVCGSAE